MQEESKSVSDNIKWMCRKKFERGELVINTRRFLGYDKDANGNLIINHTEAEILKRIYTEYLADNGAFKIAKLLDIEGIPTVTRSRWNEASILDILKNAWVHLKNLLNMHGSLAFSVFKVLHIFKRVTRYRYFGLVFLVFAYYFIAKMADEMQDERYFENSKKAKLKTAAIPLVTLFIVGFGSGFPFVTKELII